MSGYALLKKPLGGPWNAQKEIQETGKRFKEIGKNTYGPPYLVPLVQQILVLFQLFNL